MCEFHTRYCWNWQLCHSLSENHTHLTWWCRYAQCAHKRWLLNCDKSHQTFRLNVLKIKRTLKCSVNSQVHMLSKRWYQWWNSHLHPFDFGTLLSITNRIRKISISANSSCSFAQDSERTQQWTYKKQTYTDRRTNWFVFSIRKTRTKNAFAEYKKMVVRLILIFAFSLLRPSFKSLTLLVLAKNCVRRQNMGKKLRH